MQMLFPLADLSENRFLKPMIEFACPILKQLQRGGEDRFFQVGRSEARVRSPINDAVARGSKPDA